MMGKLNKSLVFASAFLIASCGDSQSNGVDLSTATDPSTSTSASASEANFLAHFQYSSTVSANVKRSIEFDLKNLYAWNDITRSDAVAKFAAVSGLEQVNAKTLSQWIADRITYIYPATGEDFKIAIINSKQQKIRPTTVPGVPKTGIVAANMGAQIYAAYPLNKDAGAAGLMIDFNEKYKPFMSIRTGVMMLGPTFEASSASLDDPAQVGLNIRNSIIRINALIHEARHSDGNISAGTHAMLHVNCPDTITPVEYKGLQICDKWSNGPNVVGALAIPALLGLCDGKCSNEQKTTLEAIRIDQLARMAVTTDAANYGNATPEIALPTVDISSFPVVP